MGKQYRKGDMLSAQEVADYLGLSRPWVYMHSSEKNRPKGSDFPRPVKLGSKPNSPIRWRFEDVEKWVARDKMQGRKTDPDVQRAYRELKERTGVRDDVVLLKSVLGIMNTNFERLDRLTSRLNSWEGRRRTHAQVLEDILKQHEKFLDVQKELDPRNAP